MTSHLSLLSLHTEPYNIRDDIYTTTNPVLPNQHRNLRLRARRRPLTSVKGKAKAGKVVSDEGWEYELTYLSPALSSREYSEMMVKACVGSQIVGMNARIEIEEFIEALGFR